MDQEMQNAENTKLTTAHMNAIFGFSAQVRASRPPMNAGTARIQTQLYQYLQENSRL